MTQDELKVLIEDAVTKQDVSICQVSFLVLQTSFLPLKRKHRGGLDRCHPQ